MKCAFDIRNSPADITGLMGTWLDTFDKNYRDKILLGCGALLWSIWRMRNDVVFKDRLPNDPTELIYNDCSCLDKWLILQKKSQRNKVELGNQLLRRIASEAFRRAKWLGTCCEKDF